MKIFDKRPLSLILCMLLGGFVFFSVFNDAWRIAISSIGLLILLFALFVPLKEFKGRVLTVICSAAILVGCLLSFLYFDLYYFVDEDLKGEVEICGVVTESESFSYGKELTIITETIDGEKVRKHKIRTFATLDECEDISEGVRIKIKGRLCDIDAGGDYDMAAYYHAAGYSAELVEIDTLEYVEYAGVPLSSKIEAYRDSLCRRLIINSNEESGGLLCALLLGDRSYLSSETRHDFTRLGLSHMLALSGMHLAILSFGLDALMSRLGIMKKPRKIVQIIFVLLYMALTGFPSSVMRAGIMLIITTLLFLLSHRADSITTLFLAVTAILIIEPYAAFDISLWLSAFATLGILLYAEYNESAEKAVGKPSLKRRVLRATLQPIIISVFAINATLLMSASTFKGFSLLAPISTPIYSVIIELYMYLGILFLLLGRFLSLGALVKPCGGFITWSIRHISSINGIYVSAEYIIVSILLIVFTVSLCAFAILNIKRKRSAVTLLVCMLIVIFATAFSCSVYADYGNSFKYTVDSSDEWIVMQDNGSISLLDISTPSSRIASMQADALNDMGIVELDRYVFTHYSLRSPETIRSLLGSMLVEEIYLPTPQNESELTIAGNIIAENENSKSIFVFYNSEEPIRCDKFNIFPAYRDSDKNKLALTILYQDEFYTYLSSGMLENDTKNVALPLIDGCNTLILGRHGNSYSSYKFIYQVNDLKRLVISSKSLTIPSETKRYYNDQGTAVDISPTELDLYVE